MSIRPQQVAANMQRAVQDAIARGVHDPRVRGLISVTNVRVSADMRDATVCVSVLPADRSELTLHGLRSAAKMIRSRVAESLQMRAMPRLRFELDNSLKNQAALESAIRDGAPPADGEFEHEDSDGGAGS